MPQTTPGDPRDGGQHRPEAGQAERSSQAGGRRPVRTYRMSLGRRVGDAIISALIRAGVVPSSYLLTTRGRKTGRLRTNPVTIVESNGRR